MGVVEWAMNLVRSERAAGPIQSKQTRHDLKLNGSDHDNSGAREGSEC